MFENLSESLPVILDLTQYIAYIIGIAAITVGLGGLMKLSSDPRSASLGKPIGEIFVGGMLMTTDRYLPLIISSFTSDYQATTNVLSYLGAGGGSSAMEQAFKSVLSFAQFLGVIAILRGMLLFKKASNPTAQGSGEDAAYSGLMFVVFGSLAANMKWTLTVASSFFGFPLPSFLGL